MTIGREHARRDRPWFDRRKGDTGTRRSPRRWRAMPPMYEFRYYYGDSPDPAIEYADLTDDAQAAVRAVRELLGMPSRYSVEVWREGVVIFCRTRTRHLSGVGAFRLYS